LREYEEVEPIILASDQEVSIKEVAFLIRDALHFKGDASTCTSTVTAGLRIRKHFRKKIMIWIRIRILRIYKTAFCEKR
jgi:hypothetical protein